MVIRLSSSVCLLGVREKGEVEEDGEGQVEVEGEEGEVKEKRSCKTMNVDEMRLKNTLSHEVHVTQTSRGVSKLRDLSAVLTGCATCACTCSCTCCCCLCHACPRRSCCCSCCKYTVFVANSVVGDVLFTLQVVKRTRTIRTYHRLKRRLIVHDLQLVFQFYLQSVENVCSSYEDPNVDDMEPRSNNRDGSEDSGGCSTSAVLD